MGRRKVMSDEDLLARVRDIVSREGTSISSRKIAEEVGVSNSVLFQRFGSKDELILAAMAPDAPDIADLLDYNAPLTVNVLEDIAIRLLGYFRDFVPILLQLATHPNLNYETFRTRYPDSPLESLRDKLMAYFEHQLGKSAESKRLAGVVVLNLISVAFSLATFERIGAHGGRYEEQVVRGLASAVWVGISDSAAG